MSELGKETYPVRFTTKPLWIDLTASVAWSSVVICTPDGVVYSMPIGPAPFTDDPHGK